VDLTGPPATALGAKVVFSPITNTVGPAIAATLLSSAASALTPTTQGLIDFSAAPGVGEAANSTHLSAKPGGAADGAFGNAFVIYTAGPIVGQAAVTVSTSTTTAGLAAGQTAVIIAYPAGAYATGQQLAAALNGNAVFNSILVANSTNTATAVGASGAVGSAPVLFGALAGGHAFYAVTAILSKQVAGSTAAGGPIGTAANWAVKTAGVPSGAIAEVVNNFATPSIITSVVIATTYLNVPVHGTSTLTWTNPGGVQDFAGNAFATQTVTIS
jgi:hypothetical protein